MIFNKIFKRFKKEEYVERWSQEKIEFTKEYLEIKPPEKWTKEDHYLAVEFLFHRYIPENEKIEKEKFDLKMNELRGKIDFNIENPNAPKQEIKKDPEFEEWMKKVLTKKEV